MSSGLSVGNGLAKVPNEFRLNLLLVLVPVSVLVLVLVLDYTHSSRT